MAGWREIDELAHRALEERAARVVQAEIAREVTARASRLGDDLLAEQGVDPAVRRPPLRPTYPRFGYRRAIEVAVRRRMVTPAHLASYRRLLLHRARAAATGQRLDLQGVAFLGRDVELRARPRHGRLVLGPWCWVGDRTRLRVHQGQLTLGAKVVLGCDNIVNVHLDVEIGDASLLADRIYICDFDHRFDRLDVPIKDQGIVTSPTRLGRDVWVGVAAAILRGVDVGDGTVVAAHAVLNADVAPYAIVAGVPGRVVGSRLPPGVDPEEAADLLRRGLALPGDP